MVIRTHGRTGTRTSCGAEGEDAVTWRDGTCKDGAKVVDFCLDEWSYARTDWDADELRSGR